MDARIETRELELRSLRICGLCTRTSHSSRALTRTSTLKPKCSLLIVCCLLSCLLPCFVPAFLLRVKTPCRMVATEYKFAERRISCHQHTTQMHPCFLASLLACLFLVCLLPSLLACLLPSSLLYFLACLLASFLPSVLVTPSQKNCIFALVFLELSLGAGLNTKC